MCIALALSARGMNVTVFEGAESPREAGAGLSIPPNAVALLKRTSLCDDFEKITCLATSRDVATMIGDLHEIAGSYSGSHVPS
jgi:salicylate hydroxylase